MLPFGFAVTFGFVVGHEYVEGGDGVVVPQWLSCAPETTPLLQVVANAGHGTNAGALLLPQLTSASVALATKTMRIMKVFPFLPSSSL